MVLRGVAAKAIVRYAWAVRCFIPTGPRLVVVRSEPFSRYRGRRLLPGGKVDPGETAEEAARREVREETGLVVDVVGVYPFVIEELPTPGNGRRHRLWLFAEATVVGVAGVGEHPVHEVDPSAAASGSTRTTS